MLLGAGGEAARWAIAGELGTFWQLSGCGLMLRRAKEFVHLASQGPGKLGGQGAHNGCQVEAGHCELQQLVVVPAAVGTPHRNACQSPSWGGREDAQLIRFRGAEVYCLFDTHLQ